MDNREYSYDTHVYQNTNNINSISYLGVWFYFMKFTAQKSFIAPLIVSTILLTGGLSGCAMLGIGGEKSVNNPTARGGIHAITRHPLMWAITIWSAVHLLNNGDVKSVIFFAGLGGVALLGTVMIDKSS